MKSNKAKPMLFLQIYNHSVKIMESVKNGTFQLELAPLKNSVNFLSGFNSSTFIRSRANSLWLFIFFYFVRLFFADFYEASTQHYDTAMKLNQFNDWWPWLYWPITGAKYLTRIFRIGSVNTAIYRLSYKLSDIIILCESDVTKFSES